MDKEFFHRIFVLLKTEPKHRERMQKLSLANFWYTTRNKYRTLIFSFFPIFNRKEHTIIFRSKLFEFSISTSDNNFYKINDFHRRA